MSSESLRYQSNIFYRDMAVLSMPRRCHLKDGSTQLVVDYARQQDLSVCLEMIKDSAVRGDNVGEDEFSEDRTDLLLTTSQIFAVRELDGRSSLLPPKAFLIISPSWFSRTFDICLAGLYIFRSKELQSDDDLFTQLLRLAVQFAIELNLGYTNAIYSVAGCLHGLVRILRQEGFIRVATIPDSVRIAGVGLWNNFFMVKPLAVTPRPRRPAEVQREMMDKIFPPAQCTETYERAALQRASFLPVKYIFNNGLAVMCRNMEKEEDQVVYDIWKSAASQGFGYGADEMPTLSTFRMSVLLDHYCIVFEEISTGKIVGMTLIAPSWYSRSSTEKHGESNLFIKQEYRGRGMGTEAISIELCLMKQLGFRASLNDALASNSIMLAAINRSRLSSANHWTTVGVIPHGCFTEGYGWDDQVINWLDFSNNPDMKDFTELAANTLHRSANDSKL